MYNIIYNLILHNYKENHIKKKRKHREEDFSVHSASCFASRAKLSYSLIFIGPRFQPSIKQRAVPS